MYVVYLLFISDLILSKNKTKKKKKKKKKKNYSRP